jgi:aspartyl/asparaginyl beta-hydroxylase (cupin superfamily)
MTVSAEETALRQRLAVQPRDLHALLAMGQLKARDSDDRAATSFFQTALSVASLVQSVPPELHPQLRAAQGFLATANQRFEAHLIDKIDKLGVISSTRIAHALDLLLGKRELFVQQPSSFYFPGLPQRQFFERAEFDWLSDVEAAVPAMQAELRAIIAEDRDFAPYVVSSPERPLPSNPLRDDPSWGALYLWQNGKRVEANANRAPATMNALAAAPIPVIEQRSPMALFSLLKPGTHIQPHHGLLNTRLICHIPLIVPGDCALRVGNETRAWREGEALIFDDSFEHEAWNNSDQTRIVLLFEIWRPEIDDSERAALTAIFEAINDYGGAPHDAG